MFIPTLLGAAVFFGVMWQLSRAHSRMWRSFVRYAAPPRTPALASKFPESIVITVRGRTGPLVMGNALYRLYAGVRISVHSDGLTLSLVPPFSVMCPDLFLPFSRLKLDRTSWGLWEDPFAIRMNGVDDADIVLDRSTVRWIREHRDAI